VVNLILDRSTASSKMDAVLPITLRDYERFTILQRTISLFCRDLFNVIWIVVPDRDLEEIKERIKDANYCVISDSELVPEFKLFPNRGGWFNQQLIKLAIASSVETDFYLTLDADVICVKPVHFSDLVKEGHAAYYRYSADKFGDFNEWYEWAERVLRFQIPNNFRYHNVTPSVLSKAAVLQLQIYLAECSQAQIKHDRKFNFLRRNNWLLLKAKLLQAVLPKSSVLREQLSNWKAYLLRNIPWTEYSLYYAFCETQGLINSHHDLRDHCVYSTEDSIWYKSQYADWNPERWFDQENNFFFCVLQSTTETDPNEVWEKIKPHISNLQ
jgi:Family of unknown function (DUF6492)